MTVTPEISAEEIDLYREVHKGLRLALFDLAAAAGALDASDPEALAELGRRFAALDMMLSSHHAHEDGAELRALIREHAEAVGAEVEEAHDRFQVEVAEPRDLVDRLCAGTGDAGELYDAILTFVAAYLAHMELEEHKVMPALRRGVPVERLQAITMAIRGSVPPPDMCVFLRWMLPAMSPDERTSTLGGMKAGAPPEIFEMFWRVAQEVLGPDDLATVEARIAV